MRSSEAVVMPYTVSSLGACGVLHWNLFFLQCFQATNMMIRKIILMKRTKMTLKMVMRRRWGRVMMLLGVEGQHIEDDDEWVDVDLESRPGFPERSVTAARLPQALCFTFTLYSW